MAVLARMMFFSGIAFAMDGGEWRQQTGNTLGRVAVCTPAATSIAKALIVRRHSFRAICRYPASSTKLGTDAFWVHLCAAWDCPTNAARASGLCHN
jgi:hypothetical protein